MDLKLKFIINADGTRFTYDFCKGTHNIEVFKQGFDNKRIVQCILIGQKIDIMRSLKIKFDLIPNIIIKNQSRYISDDDYKTDQIYYDLGAKNTSKGLAVIHLCSKLNLDLTQAMAIGDNINDISMFQYIENSVAMGNASSIVKQTAKTIINDNNHDGIYDILNDVYKHIKNPIN